MNSGIQFNKERFDASDEKAKVATKKLFAVLEPSWTLIDNPNKYGVDFIAYSNGNLVCYIEVELSNNGFEKGRFKYDRIRLLPRKDHFLDGLDTNGEKLKAPIYLCTISSDCKSAIIYEMATMKKNSIKVKSVNNVPLAGRIMEEMNSLSTNFCSEFYIN